MPSSNLEKNEVEKLVKGVLTGERTELARAITIVESTSDKHIALSAEMLQACLPSTGKSIRIGITGAPGVGKSTFINTFGQYLIEKAGKKVAVLAIDPSSTLTHGSILGDKTRMQELSTNPSAFVRPSPSRGDLGGVAARTRESILLCEAAGYDIILVETVGVGQSETSVSDMVDFFLLLLLPGAGDQLQGIKKGIVEMADAIAVNKADGENLKLAKEAVLHYKQALQFGHGAKASWQVPVIPTSAAEGTGMGDVWHSITKFGLQSYGDNSWDENRTRQNTKWFDEHIKQLGMRKLLSSKVLQKRRAEILHKIEKGEVHPMIAAADIVKDLVR